MAKAYSNFSDRRILKTIGAKDTYRAKDTYTWSGSDDKPVHLEPSSYICIVRVNSEKNGNF